MVCTSSSPIVNPHWFSFNLTEHIRINSQEPSFLQTRAAGFPSRMAWNSFQPNSITASCTGRDSEQITEKWKTSTSTRSKIEFLKTANFRHWNKTWKELFSWSHISHVSGYQSHASPSMYLQEAHKKEKIKRVYAWTYMQFQVQACGTAQVKSLQKLSYS